MLLHKKSGFTLIELLVVMTIIVILAGLILALIPYINQKQARSRAEGEMGAIKAALENYKADNATYPNDANVAAGLYQKNNTDNLDAQTMNDPTQPAYISAGLVLYRALSGDRNLDRKVDTTGSTDTSLDLDGNALATPLASPPNVYYTFKANQLLPTGGTGTVTQIIDPFGNSYGYSTAYQGDISAANTSTSTTTATTPTHGYNPTYDLWSTGGQVGNATDTITQTSAKRAKWLINWQNSGANVGQ